MIIKAQVLRDKQHKDIFGSFIPEGAKIALYQSSMPELIHTSITWEIIRKGYEENHAQGANPEALDYYELIEVEVHIP